VQRSCQRSCTKATKHRPSLCRGLWPMLTHVPGDHLSACAHHSSTPMLSRHSCSLFAPQRPASELARVALSCKCAWQCMQYEGQNEGQLAAMREHEACFAQHHSVTKTLTLCCCARCRPGQGQNGTGASQVRTHASTVCAPSFIHPCDASGACPCWDT
jgi:hypothetical protein